MAATMRARVLHGIGEVGIIDQPIRTAPCPGESARMSRPVRRIQDRSVGPPVMTTRRLKFADIKKAFKMMRTKDDGMIKPLSSRS